MKRREKSAKRCSPCKLNETREESEREKNSSWIILAQYPVKLYLSWKNMSSDVGKREGSRFLQRRTFMQAKSSTSFKSLAWPVIDLVVHQDWKWTVLKRRWAQNRRISDLMGQNILLIVARMRERLIFKNNFTELEGSVVYRRNNLSLRLQHLRLLRSFVFIYMVFN